MKRTLVSIFCVLVVLAAFANGKVIVHKVQKGETLYSISKHYGLKVNELVKANPILHHDMHIKLGQKLTIPANLAEAAVITKPIKVHSVASTNDTPYTDEDNRNRITTAQAENAIVSIGNDPILVEKPKPNAESTPVSLRTNSSNAAEYPAIFSQYFTSGYKAKRSRGAANYLADNTTGNQYLAFYNDAESGSIIKVTNMMNKKTVYVKVVGKVPPVDASKEVILKLSNKAARDLGALDDKFLVEVLGCTN